MLNSSRASRCSTHCANISMRTGPKRVCDRAECGACTVLIDNRLVYSCTTLAIEAQGKEIVTAEGLGESERPHPVQSAFVNNDAQQCGFCTPGSPSPPNPFWTEIRTVATQKSPTASRESLPLRNLPRHLRSRCPDDRTRAERERQYHHDRSSGRCISERRCVMRAEDKIHLPTFRRALYIGRRMGALTVPQSPLATPNTHTITTLRACFTALSFALPMPTRASRISIRAKPKRCPA